MKEALLKTYVGKSIQVKFKGDMKEVGEGKLEELGDGLFRVNVQAALGDPRNPQVQPTPIVWPLDFEADDVLWVSEGPRHPNGEKLVHEMAAPQHQVPGRTAGGLVIPR